MKIGTQLSHNTTHASILLSSLTYEYPFLHKPYGSNFSISLQNSVTKTMGRDVSTKFYGHELFQLPNKFETVLKAGFLLPQYFVDQYCMVDFECFQYLCQDQYLLQASQHRIIFKELEDTSTVENENL